MTPKDLNDYKKSLEGKTLEELEALEQEIIKEADKLNENMSKAMLRFLQRTIKKQLQLLDVLLINRVFSGSILLAW